ncbi:enoyl-CoA hydratase/isomerase family protein [Bradyrhizobium genomosp. I (2014)]|uniref:enoyl-CoA hydratase/isomerase family protein n=1 Tax=Bradyrhizobium genomosp. I (2014) TaxID=2683269 RepID=UPI0004AE7DD0|nr:enoyl-CoA hydratase/isomerase family protein [Bradyrhizobium sp. CCBAU 43298]
MARQITIDKLSSGLWTATFNNPPINLVDPDTIGELQDLLAQLESDAEIKVVVFRSADPDFFLAHWDVLADKRTVAAMPPGPTGMHPWIDLLVRLSRAPVASIAEIRGRARGAGSEFVLACDMRFASRERAILGQFEVGLGAVPGGNPMARLAGLMGRGRGLEVILGADDFSAELAERYGYVNRALPDEELSTFVESFARRLASFEKHAIVGAKALMDQVTLPADAVFPPSLSAFFASVAHPGTRKRAASLLERGLQRRSETEMRLGQAVAEASSSERD